MSRQRIVRLACLAAAGPFCLLPGWWALGLVAAALLVWISLRPRRRVAAVVLPLAAAAVGLLLAGQWGRWIPREARLEQAVANLDRLMTELDVQAERAARELLPPQGDSRRVRAAFEDLRRLAAATEPRERTLRRSWILFDPDGEPVAWAGRGLLHEVEGEALPRAGRVHVGSFTANTFLSVAAIGGARRPWRVGVGVSLSGDDLPGWSDGDLQWAVLESPAVPGNGAKLVEAGRLRLAVRLPDREVAGEPGGARRWAALLVALALALAGTRLGSGGSWKLDGVGAAALFVAGAVVALSSKASLWLLAPLGLGLVMSVLPRVEWSRVGEPERASGMARSLVLGVALAAAVLAASGLLVLDDRPLDLGSQFVGSLPGAALRVSLFALALGLLHWTRREDQEQAPFKWGAAALSVLLIAAAVHGWAMVGLSLLIIGSLLAVTWAQRGGWSEPVIGPVIGCLLASLIAAIAWEMAHHQALERRLRMVVAEALMPPSGRELEAEADSAQLFFADVPLETLTVGDPQGLEPEDLAFAIWRRSPLAGVGRLSTVIVGPEEAPLSSFSFGSPAATGGTAEAAPLGTAAAISGWEAGRIAGRGLLTLGGGPWTTVEYRLALRPGFRSSGSVLPTLAEGLLRRREDPLGDLAGLPPDVLFGAYAADGSVLVPPFKGAADLVSAAVPARAAIPGGWAKTFVDRDEDGSRVLFLPIPNSLTGVERVTTHAAGVLALLVAALAVWFLLTLGETDRRLAVRRGWRSFSTRLVALYTVLLIVPIVLINVLVLRVFAERLESEQQAASGAALESAQRILGDYVFSLEPGFGLDTAVGDTVMVWLSRVVHHDVNLYWGSRLSASSKRELFSAGLLPQRIPGEVYSRIALEGADLASRTTRAGGVVYEEFYAPLEVPGAPLDYAGLFVSTPLLAQEVATAEEMAALRRRILLAGAGVALLLVLVGRRVGRSFTRPLLEIVEGTQAIAAGAPSIEVDTKDTEFVTLVEAIDEMARRIARARSELLREKQVVDRMIDNITSGVVSLNRDGRVMMLNRTAHELLGILVGESLTEALGRNERLSAIAAFMQTVGDRLVQKTVTLLGEDDEEAEWTIIWVPLSGAGEPAALFVIEDVTEVLRGQRLVAWAEMARMIAHEVKNPLTPIRLSTEHLREVWRSGRGDLDRALDRCTENILRQVAELQQIVSDFSAYSRIPAISTRRGDLSELVERVVDGYLSGGPPVRFARRSGPWTAEFDTKLLSRAVRNLLENAVRATRDGGEVEVTVEGRGDRIEIRVEDTGRGVEGEHLARIFEPYFSTEDSGTGLGLPIARRIVEEHLGTIVAKHRLPTGLAVVVSLPRAQEEPEPS